MADTSDTASHSSRYSPFSSTSTSASASVSASRLSDDGSTNFGDHSSPTNPSLYGLTTVVHDEETEAGEFDIDLDEDLDGDLDGDLDLDLDEELDLDAHVYADIEVDVGLDTDADEDEDEDIDIGSVTDIDIHESIDIEEDEEDEGEDEGEGESEGGENRDDDFYEGDDFNSFDFDMRDLDLDAIDGLGFFANEATHFGFDDYLGIPGDDSLYALRHTLIQYQLEHQLALEPWIRPRSPPGEQPVGGARALLRLGRDQLVQIEVAEQGHGMDASAGASGTGAAASGRPRQGQGQRQQHFPDIIDLTGDDDVAMPRPARSVPPRSSENPRRQRSQTQNAPPRLNRSDGNYVDDQHIIILSSSDDEDRPMRASPRRHAQLNHNNHGHYPPDQHRPNRHSENHSAGRGARNTLFGDQSRQAAPASAAAPAVPAPTQPQGHSNRGGLADYLQRIPIFQFLNPHQSPHPTIMANRSAPHNHNHNHNPDDEVVITGARNIAELPRLLHAHAHAHAPGPRQFIGLGPIQLDYGGHPFPLPPHPGPPAAAAGPPKPAHEPPPPARPGFTRDTGEDVVAICPSCDQELAYDPEDDDKTSTTPVRKSRAKNATAEHHFWAVKACGHVYCKYCFDNRRPTAKSAARVGFRPSSDGSKKILCAVEDCDSEVSTKTAWVGIFM